jgi:hypothetical protein
MLLEDQLRLFALSLCEFLQIYNIKGMIEYEIFAGMIEPRYRNATRRGQTSPAGETRYRPPK